MNLAWRAATSLAALVPLGAGFVVPGAAPPASSGTVDAPAHYVVPPSPASVSPAGTTGARSPARSDNWSGYAALGASFHEAQGSWVEPTAHCAPRGTGAAAFWVGIDGASGGTVQQDGTDADCRNGAPAYYAWDELYPQPSGELNPRVYPVRPGDVMTSTITDVSGQVFRLTLADGRGGRTLWTFSRTATATGAHDTSAEWIAEAPTVCNPNCHLATLSNFGTVHFTGSETRTPARTGTIAAFAHDAITMVNQSSRAVEATPSGLGGSGGMFSVTRR